MYLLQTGNIGSPGCIQDMENPCTALKHPKWCQHEEEDFGNCVSKVGLPRGNEAS